MGGGAAEDIGVAGPLLAPAAVVEEEGVTPPVLAPAGALLEAGGIAAEEGACAAEDSRGAGTLLAPA